MWRYKREKITEECMTLYNDGLQKLYIAPYVIRMVKGGARGE